MPVSLIYSTIQRAKYGRQGESTRPLRRCRSDAMRYVLSHPTDRDSSQDCAERQVPSGRVESWVFDLAQLVYQPFQRAF